jgi:hypothetical protein
MRSGNTLNSARQSVRRQADRPVLHRAEQSLGRGSARTERRLRARLHHGWQSHRVITLTVTGQLGMAAPGQIRLAVVIHGGQVAASDLRALAGAVHDLALQ